MPISESHIAQKSGDISKLTFQVTIGVALGLSIASVIARVALRIYSRRSLFLDDYIVLAGVICLCAASGLLYGYCDYYFLSGALKKDPSLFFQLESDQLGKLLKVSTTYVHAFLAFIWTTIFAVKFSFLAFFKKLIERVTKIHTYYWIVVAITGISWPFLVVEPFILCHYFGPSALKCYASSQDLLYVSMSGLVTGLDVLTDVLIVSIPIIILRRSKIKTGQKIALGSFLCLSLVMAIIAIIRVSRIHSVAGIDMVWEFFWQTMEGCVAVLMASITAFRTVFASHGTRESGEKRWVPSYTWIQRARERKWKNKNNADGDQLPSIPRALMTGMRTFIRKHDRTAGGTTNLTDCGTCTSQMDDETQSSVESRAQEKQVLVRREWRVESSSNRSSEVPRSAFSNQTTDDSGDSFNKYGAPRHKETTQNQYFV